MGRVAGLHETPLPSPTLLSGPGELEPSACRCSCECDDVPPDPTDPLDVLAKVGGFEIGGLAGLVIGSAAAGIPVVCDGLIATAGALIACELAPAAKAYLFASHRSVEVGHRFMHERLGVEPLLDLRFRLGEGTGAAVAMELLDAATRVLCDIKTFEEVAIVDAQKQ